MMTSLISIASVTVLEGSAGTQNAAVTVNVSEPHSNAVSVDYSTAAGSATAGSDYKTVSGKLTFAKNEMSKTILIPVVGDRVAEASESFFVNLKNAKGGAKIANSPATVTILDDEPRINLNDASVVEGNSGPAALTFTVNLSATYDQAVSVNYTTTDDSAIAGTDYAAAAGTVTFQPGQMTQNVTVLVNGDRLSEADKSFGISLSAPSSNAYVDRSTAVGTIFDDEPRISIASAWNYGEATFTFTVSLQTMYDESVTVNFATADGTAFTSLDYVATAGTITFDPGQTNKTITVDVLDPTSRPDKYFAVRLSDASAKATLLNDLAFGNWYYDPGYYDPGYYDPGYYDPYVYAELYGWPAGDQ